MNFMFLFLYENNLNIKNQDCKNVSNFKTSFVLKMHTYA